MGAGAPVIEAHNVHKIYDTSSSYTHALKGVSFTINEGDFVAIIGPSGSGKSTLMNILGCLDTPTVGQYRIAGHDVANLSSDELAQLRRAQLGFVFQSFNLLPRTTLMRNVMVPMMYSNVPPKQRRRIAESALNEVDLPSELWNKKSNEISGGQMQRVAIARALVNNPRIILADEPTGNLDTATSATIMALFHRLNSEGHTIVLITHEPEIANHAHRVIRIQDGHLTEVK